MKPKEKETEYAAEVSLCLPNTPCSAPSELSTKYYVAAT